MKDEYIDIPVQHLHGAFGYLMNCTVTETGMTLDECVEKQIAKKVITYKGTNRADCPTCGATVRMIDKPFGDWCSKCGNKLDWGNEDAEDKD